MKAEIYWVEHTEVRLGILPRPRGGASLLDEMESLKAQGVDDLVSLLTPDEVRELELEREAEVCAEVQIAFYRFAIEDRDVPRDLSALNALPDRLGQA